MNCPVCDKPVALYRHKDGVHPKCRAKAKDVQVRRGERHDIRLGIAGLSQAQRDAILRRIAGKG